MRHSASADSSKIEPRTPYTQMCRDLLKKFRNAQHTTILKAQGPREKGSTRTISAGKFAPGKFKGFIRIMREPPVPKPRTVRLQVLNTCGVTSTRMDCLCTCIIRIVVQDLFTLYDVAGSNVELPDRILMSKGILVLPTATNWVREYTVQHEVSVPVHSYHMLASVS